MTTILVGKNAHHNDELCKNMSGSDYWFHATEYPGAHVIVKGNPTEADLNYAAQLAATHSKSKEDHVSVGMCRGVDIEKPKDFPPGQVIARNRRHFIVSKM